jgi:hypothetical protein
MAQVSGVPGGDGPVTEPEREVLVLLDPARGDEAVADLRMVAQVTQRVPPHVVLVAADAASAGQLTSIVGVVGVYVGEAPSSVAMTGLSEGERIFVDGWAERADLPRGPGGGLSWGDPGYSPPDPPAAP